MQKHSVWVDAGWVLRIFWACRVSVLSAGAGVALFCYVPAQNLMADVSFFTSWTRELLFWSGVFALSFLMWAVPVHYAARLTLRDPDWILAASLHRDLSPDCRDDLARCVRRRYAWLIVWVPRFLGVTPFAALLVGILGGAGAVRHAQALPTVALTLRQAWWLGGADFATAAGFLLFVWFRQPLSARLDFRFIAGVSAPDFLLRIAIAITSLYFVASYFFPVTTSVWTPRAMLVPPLFGCSVFGLSWLARFGHRTGAPVLLGLAAFAVAVTALNASFNDLRTLPAAPHADLRLPVDEALQVWAKANGCAITPPAGDIPATARGCPRPVVIAIDGGASRAAFAAATFIGQLIDAMGVQMPPTARESPTPGRRVFAISGVSGGSFAAAVLQAALADAQASGPPTRAPCRYADRTWFRYAEHPSGDFTWRECLQVLTSGDNLSPTIIGLAFRDAFAPPGMPIVDRAALLEQSFERHYGRILDLQDADTACDRPAAMGLCRAMARPKEWLQRHPGGWMPLLLLNGTSVETGRRLISADLASAPPAPTAAGALYTEAYDLREAMSSQCPRTRGLGPTPADPGRTVTATITAAARDGRTQRTILHGTCADPEPLDGPDIRLSTAAVASARFPIVSPAGAFLMHDSTGLRYGDQVVDGGYFENSGITTALDIVAALEQRGSLEPLIVSVGNDPEADKIDAGLPRRPSETPLVLKSGNDLFGRAVSVVGAPLATIMATRDGHADEALHAAQVRLGNRFHRFQVEKVPDFSGSGSDQTCRDFEGKTVEMTKVSMSWWLSAAVQADLDAQRCSASNRAVLAKVLGQVKASE